MKPVKPVSAAGWRIEPPVSVPVAAGARRAATAAAEPPEEPPGTFFGSQGLRTGPYQLFSFEEPIANSSMFVLPSMTTPACASRSTTVASYGATKFDSIREPQVVRTPSVQKMSLWTSGRPVSGIAFAGRDRLIGLLRSGERLLAGDGDEGVQRRIEALDTREKVPRELHAGEAARTQALVELRERQSM